ncbi:hypothetical protein AB3N61_01670 [Leptospira sp. WS58.C1]|uniref:hypothetical protein n=1 Tax=Leptospira TaxID=171 RepID=UPI0002BF9293|nr:MULTISPECIES: hypothetical protein [Leptospira]EMJ99750.1 hypothetical protein LEP1GSC192_0951 [Leptospira sp. B5-022]MCR1793945.1 hypothetical protein [Leptospira sp. id769339]
MSEETAEKKNKKINKMSAGELDQALKNAVEKMNGETSKYVQHLKARKEELANKK